jgi:hypothetical protein
MGVSVLLLPLFEVEANRQVDTYYGDRIFGEMATALRTSSGFQRLWPLVSLPASSIIYSIEASIDFLIPKVRAAANGLLR